MSFLSPAFLLGLPLIAVPVLIHFFARRQRTLIRWGAMEFLFAGKTPQRRFMRLRDLLLLLLRIAIVLIIVGALAQPMLSSSWLGTTGPRDVIVILDNSMSTARKLGTGTVFDREVDEVVKLTQQLKANDVIRVLLAAPTPEWLTDTPVAGSSGSLQALVDRLQQLKPNDTAADELGCVQEAIKARRVGKDISRFITVVTDGQAHGWRADMSGAWSIAHAQAKKATFPISMRVIVAGAQSGPVANLTVEKISAARTVIGVGQPATLTAAIKNNGTTTSAAISLTWMADKQSLGISTIPALEPGEGTTVNLNPAFANAGPVDISCELSAQDELSQDNSAHFALEVASQVPILIVEGEPQSDPMQSDTQYFLAALGIRPGAKESPASVFKVKSINYQSLRSEDLSPFQCVVLANIPRLPADAIQKLARFVNAGGGLWIALGDQTDVAAFNHQFFEPSAGLSPLALRQPVGDADDREKFTGLVPPAADHPAATILSDGQRLDIDRVRIFRRHQFDSGQGAAVSVLFQAQGGAPVAVEKHLGRGRVIVQAVPLGLAWCNLPLCHAYVVMVHEWLWYLTEPGLVKHNLQAGELLQATVPFDASNGSATLETPTGRVVKLVGQEEGGQLTFRYLKTGIPGEYSLTIPGTKQGSRTEKFLVCRDPVESNLTPLSQLQMKTLSEAGGLEFGIDPLFQPRQQQVEAPPKALAAWLLVALIIFMAVEIVMAFWMMYRRRSPTPAVVMKPGIRI